MASVDPAHSVPPSLGDLAGVLELRNSPFWPQVGDAEVVAVTVEGTAGPKASTRDRHIGRLTRGELAHVGDVGVGRERQQRRRRRPTTKTAAAPATGTRPRQSVTAASRCRRGPSGGSCDELGAGRAGLDVGSMYVFSFRCCRGWSSPVFGSAKSYHASVTATSHGLVEPAENCTLRSASLTKGVLYLFTGLLQVAFCLIDLALGTELVVAT